MLQLSWGKLRREPATRWFDRSFAPIPTSDERFARQYRYELPPEFPLASPCAGIAHHLSGRIDCALPWTSHKRGSQAMLPPPESSLASQSNRGSTYTFISRAGFQSRTLAQALHSLVRVSRRANELHLHSSSAVTTQDVQDIRGSCKQSHTYLPHTPFHRNHRAEMRSLDSTKLDSSTSNTASRSQKDHNLTA